MVVSPRNENTNCPEVSAGPLGFELVGATIETLNVTLAEWLLVDVAMIIALPVVPGAVYVVLAPLAVCVELNEPQVPVGVQLQSTPEFEVSFATVAATDAVALGFKVEGGGVVREIETVPVLLLAGVAEPVAPQPNRLKMEKRKIDSRRKVAVRNLRVKCTDVSLVRVVYGTHWTAPLPAGSVIQDVIRHVFGQSGKIPTKPGAILVRLP